MEHPIIVNDDGEIENLPRRLQSIRRLAASMAAPIRRSLDYQGIARRALVVEQLPQGALPIYDRDIDVSAIVLADDDKTSLAHKTIYIDDAGNVVKRARHGVRRSLDYHYIPRRSVSHFAHGTIVVNDDGELGQAKDFASRTFGQRVTVPTFEIFSSPSIKISEVKRRRFNVIDRALK